MKTEQEIETLLMSEKKLSLSLDEKSTIKSALLAHARDTLKHDKGSLVSPWSSWLIRSSVSFASLLFIFVGTAYASQDSLPGEPLYAFKVHVVEEMTHFTKISAEEKIAYNTILMDKRLNELKQLLESESGADLEALELLANQINDHVTHTIEVLASSSTEDWTQESKIDALVKINGVAKAQSKIITQNEELASISDFLDETNNSTSEAIDSTVTEFIDESSPEEVKLYLSEQISDIGEHISASTTDDVLQHLEEVNEAIDNGKIDEALLSILEAQEVIDSNSLSGESETETSRNSDQP